MNPNITLHAAVDMVATALSTGVPHPGNPETKTPPTTVVLPMFRTHGLPPPLADAGRATTHTVAEGIVYLLEQGHTIIPTGELEQLRADLEQAMAERDTLRNEQAP
jgi:hypothetical protein